MADTLKIQGMSLLQATHLAADRQLCPPRDAYRYKRKKKVKVKYGKNIPRIIMILKLLICSKTKQKGQWTNQGFVCLFVAYRPSNMRVYLRDGSAQTILRAATLR